MKVVAVVPLKLNNERLPGKNTKPLNGKPLLHYILSTLREVKRCDETYVYCSDESIVPFLLGGVKFVKRNAEFDLPTCNSMDISKSFCEAVDADIYIYTHATAPFVKASSIDKAIDAIVEGGHDSAFAVTENRGFLWLNGTPNYNLGVLPRTQDMEPFYIESCGFWVYKREIALAHGRRIGFNPKMIPVSKVEALDVDEQVDFDIAEAVCAARQHIGTHI